MVEYDNKLKSIFYSELMYLEMVLKNIVLDQLVPNMTDVSFDNIYKLKMADEQQNRALRLRRLQLKDTIHSTLSKSYRNENSMVSHFYNRGEEVPIWVIFGIISLGDFAKFTSCLDLQNRTKIAQQLGLESPADTNYQLLSSALYTIKALRNAVAHNNIVFDIRFKDSDIRRNLTQWIKQETNIQDIHLKYITDYVILICCLLKKVNADISRSINLIAHFEECINTVYAKLPRNIYNTILSTDILVKLNSLKNYIRIP